MRFSGIFEIVWSTFKNNKMRTILTVFGISIGMGAIIFLVSLGYGLQKMTVEKIASSQALMTYTLSSGNSNIVRLNQQKLSEIKGLPEIEIVGTSYNFSGNVMVGTNQTDTTVYAINDEFLKLESLKYIAGDKIRPGDNSVILSSALVKALNINNPEEIIGQNVEVVTYFDPDDLNKVSKIDVKVAAVTNEDDSNMLYAYDSTIGIPAGIDFGLLKAKMKTNTDISLSRSKLEGMGLSVYSLTETINSINNVFSIFKYVLLGFGIIALFVASLGMFNTMTVSLLERSREVAIMKVLGATDSGVYRLFILEALIMGTFGGILGIVSGWALGWLINSAFTVLSSRIGGGEIYLFYTPWYFAVLVLFASIFVGLLTGFYPARRASKINSLDVLRYE